MKIVNLVSLAVLTVWSSLSMSETKVELFTEPKPIEKWGALQIVDYPRMGTAVKIRIAQLKIPNCKAGDIISFDFGVEVTNRQYYAVEFTGKIIFTPNAYPSITGGKVVSGERGYNISPQTDHYGNVFHGMHHGTDQRSGSFVVENDGDYWLAAIYYAGGSSFTQRSEALKIEKGYGEFTAVRYREVDPYAL